MAIVNGQAGVSVSQSRDVTFLLHLSQIVTRRPNRKQGSIPRVMRVLRGPRYYSRPDIFYMRHYPLMGLLPLCLDTVRPRLYLAQEAIMRELCPISIN